MRKKTLLAIIVVIITTFCITAIAAAFSHSLEECVYTVKTNDSIWAIAEANCPDDMDIRDYVNAIMQRNDIVNSTIYPGDEIIIYVSAE